MANVVFKRGTKAQMAQEPLQEGALSFTIDDGRIHLDYTDELGQLSRKTFYSGKLTIGKHIFDGTQDVEIKVYDGAKEDN